MNGKVDISLIGTLGRRHCSLSECRQQERERTSNRLHGCKATRRDLMQQSIVLFYRKKFRITAVRKRVSDVSQAASDADAAEGM